MITPLDQFSWRTADLGLAPPGQHGITLSEGQTDHFEGWAIVPSGDNITFTDDAAVTRHDH